MLQETLADNNAQLQERDTQISQQQRELQALKVRDVVHRYCVVVVT